MYKTASIFNFTADSSRLQLEPDNRPKKVFKEIDVEYPDLDKKPHFEFPLRDRYIQERDTFKLTCTLQGNPPPEVITPNFQKNIFVTLGRPKNCKMNIACLILT